MSQAAPPIARSNLLFDRAQDLFMRATRRGFWPMLDQGVVSIGNFLTFIIAARGLVVKDDYATFGQMMEFMFYLNNLQSGLITYPLTVRGAVANVQSLRRLISASALLTCMLAVPFIIGALIFSAAYGKLALGAIAVVAMIVWQLQETLRRGQWAHFRHKEALAGDLVSYIGQAVGMIALWKVGNLTLMNIFVVITITSAAAAVVQALQIGVHSIRWAEFPEIARDFWITGRWVALTNLSAILSIVCGSWALRIFHGGQQVADFFAIGNLLKLCNPIMASIGGLITPAAARRLAQSGVKAAAQSALRYCTLGSAMLAPYLLFIALLPSLTMQLAYGRSTPYLGQELALQGCVIGYVFIYLLSVVGAFFNGIHRSRYSFYGQIVLSVTQFAILLPLNIKYGLEGMVWGGVIQAFLALCLMLVFARVAVRDPALAGSAIDPLKAR